MPCWSREALARGCSLALLAGTLALTPACGDDPETVLLGCWTETSWDYERLDDVAVAPQRWNDGVRFRSFPDRPVVRHEAELWHFLPRGHLKIADLDGSLTSARWRLKGRGHVLTIRYDENHFEVYDIKQRSRDELVLHFDMGMEVRGIARLQFTRTSCEAAALAGRIKLSDDEPLAPHEPAADPAELESLRQQAESPSDEPAATGPKPRDPDDRGDPEDSAAGDADDADDADSTMHSTEATSDATTGAEGARMARDRSPERSRDTTSSAASEGSRAPPGSMSGGEGAGVSPSEEAAGEGPR